MWTKSAHIETRVDVIGRIYPLCLGLVDYVQYDVRMQFNQEAFGRARR
jgi:hypothetical protein